MCDSSLANSMPQLSCHNDALNLESEIFAANNHVILIGSSSEELRLLSSLNTLGYIEFDSLCNISTLKNKFFMNLELPCLSRNTFHAIEQYSCEGEFMVRRVYICSNLTSPYGTTYCDKIDDCTNSNHVISSAFRSASFVVSH